MEYRIYTTDVFDRPVFLNTRDEKLAVGTFQQLKSSNKTIWRVGKAKGVKTAQVTRKGKRALYGPAPRFRSAGKGGRYGHGVLTRLRSRA
jgi:hypothetical protein